VPYEKLSCILPLSPRDPQSTWSVSISNNNITFSDAKRLFVYDSKCLSCTGNNAKSCSLKVGDFQLFVQVQTLLKPRRFINLSCATKVVGYSTRVQQCSDVRFLAQMYSDVESTSLAVF